MLSERFFTALGLVAVLVLVVFFTSYLVFSVFLSFICLLALWEWLSLAGIDSKNKRLVYCMSFCLLAVLTYLFLQEYLPLILLLNLCFWLVAFIFIACYPKFRGGWDNSAAYLVMGLLVLLPAWFSMYHLRGEENFTFNFFSIIFLVAAADVGAYFSGRYFGKHKLAEAVSPNKTWEGVIGGIVLCALVLVLLSEVANALYGTVFSLVALITLPLFISFFSVIGDLFESMLKRNRGVKDSGRILPGHGGMLDRIDGLLAVAPSYILMLTYTRLL